MASRRRGRRGHPRGTGQAPPSFDQPPVFDQQAFTEAVGIVVAAIARACAVVNQGGSNDLQRIEAHHSSLGRAEDWMTYEAHGIYVLVLRGRKIHLLPIWERGRRLLLHTSFRTRARIGHLVR